MKSQESDTPIDALESEALPCPRNGITMVDVDVDIDDDALDRERELSAQAKPFAWNGRQLHPFAIDRESDWLLLRAALQKPSLLITTSDPSSFLYDSMAIVWFCSHSPSDWVSESPNSIDKKIRDWAAKNIHAGQQHDLIQLGFNIYNRAHSTQVALKPEVRGGGANDMGK